MDTYKPMDTQTIANGYIQTNGHPNYSKQIMCIKQMDNGHLIILLINQTS